MRWFLPIRAAPVAVTASNGTKSSHSTLSDELPPRLGPPVAGTVVRSRVGRTQAARIFLLIGRLFDARRLVSLLRAKLTAPVAQEDKSSVGANIPSGCRQA